MQRFLLIAFISIILIACQPAPDLPEQVGLSAIPPTANQSSTLLPTIDQLPTDTPAPTTFPTLILPTLTAYPDDLRFSIGQSVEGRDIWVWQFGEGESDITLIGGLHGGFEGNTVVLVEQLVDYFRRNPDAVLPGIRLSLIPVANPDGLVRGSDIEGRFNARGVDLNRNWGCEWEDTAYLRDFEVDPGPRPFSEPESLALRAYFIAEPPDAVLFYHSAADGIFMGACGDHQGAVWLGDLLSEATGYPHLSDFSFYEVSGDATNWLDERGIAAAIIELVSKDEPEFAENLAGVMALQCYFVLEDIEQSEAFSDLDPAIQRFCDP